MEWNGKRNLHQHLTFELTKNGFGCFVWDRVLLEFDFIVHSLAITLSLIVSFSYHTHLFSPISHIMLILLSSLFHIILIFFVFFSYYSQVLLTLFSYNSHTFLILFSCFPHVFLVFFSCFSRVFLMFSSPLVHVLLVWYSYLCHIIITSFSYSSLGLLISVISSSHLSHIIFIFSQVSYPFSHSLHHVNSLKYGLIQSLLPNGTPSFLKMAYAIPTWKYKLGICLIVITCFTGAS